MRAIITAALRIALNGGATMKIEREKLERLMKLNFFSMDALAKAAGISNKTISDLKLGKREPQAGTLKKLCKALNCSPSDLLED